jgi:hypothetical protein
MRAKISELEEAFHGRFTDHHAFLLARMLVRIDAWAKFSPIISESAGRKKGKNATGHGNPYLARALGEAAVAAVAAAKTSSFLGDLDHRRNVTFHLVAAHPGDVLEMSTSRRVRAFDGGQTEVGAVLAVGAQADQPSQGPRHGRLVEGPPLVDLQPPLNARVTPGPAHLTPLPPCVWPGQGAFPGRCSSPASSPARSHADDANVTRIDQM